MEPSVFRPPTARQYAVRIFRPATARLGFSEGWRWLWNDYGIAASVVALALGAAPLIRAAPEGWEAVRAVFASGALSALLAYVFVGAAAIVIHILRAPFREWTAARERILRVLDVWPQPDARSCLGQWEVADRMCVSQDDGLHRLQEAVAAGLVTSVNNNNLDFHLTANGVDVLARRQQARRER